MLHFAGQTEEDLPRDGGRRCYRRLVGWLVGCLLAVCVEPDSREHDDAEEERPRPPRGGGGGEGGGGERCTRGGRPLKELKIGCAAVNVLCLVYVCDVCVCVIPKSV